MRLLRTHTALLVRRILLLYVALALCRVVFARQQPRPAGIGRRRRVVAAGVRIAQVRHRIDTLLQRPVHTHGPSAAAPARTGMVADGDVLVLRRGQRRGGGDEHGRRYLLPLYAETLYGRRDILRRQRQLAAARPEVRRRELARRLGRGGHHRAYRVGLQAPAHSPRCSLPELGTTSPRR